MALNIAKLRNSSKNPWQFILSDENNPYTMGVYTNTGCFALNALLCKGDIFGGLCNGKRVVLSGEPSTAKSLFASYLIKPFLDQDEDRVVILFETEGSSIVESAKEVGIDADRIIIEPVSVVEDLHKIILKYMTDIEKDYFSTKKRTKIMFVIDSLGMLSSKKEIEDKLKDKDVSDMTRAKAIKAMYRAVSLKLSLLQTPMLTINHTYANTSGYGDKQNTGGGSGVHYAGDVHLLLTKAQRRTGTVQVGVNIKAKVKKSRWIKENIKLVIGLDFKTGLVKNSSLAVLADMVGMLKLTINDAGIGSVTYAGEDYGLEYFENNFFEFFDDEKIKTLAEKVKAEFCFGESELDIESLNSEELSAYGIQFGLLSETSRLIILPDGVKIKKNELRSNPDLIPEEIVHQIKEKILQDQQEKESE